MLQILAFSDVLHLRNVNSEFSSMYFKLYETLQIYYRTSPSQSLYANTKLRTKQSALLKQLP